ncbi:NUDIX hydrolase [Tenacibaculum finnmarkense]|uniref:Coenzyme A pyrophosphatase n=3 Tax=Tenacibaculum finnmarkense TaxID=2781243 RepID=A0A2I2M7I2_9FLAO|nr:CoA pyrophosphatase [Tenacibaculum finnmarkense]ALU74907.1 coenzyme A pyrophosphatase [Tenacibaculum dicentrarchi]MBE7634404.1 NUDIX domain-containing protein [Tenacibaculum finnmarkense genomovar ulcerans]MBE7646344.1 NUDIX domain-containing protein [Tenacibaculum finnmarkense genomovar ulcerans]MBE7648619.1 NUDIX domain-containing protein [Tenacibaculum finnmarkense genomovar ulcerans]MBE7653643.1 NUDIX domain-containing protein [Tenacibaculum finnmarkense genomovar finnmarkense]
MIFSDLTNKIAQLQTKPLGGLTSQLKLAPKLRTQFPQELIESKNPKKAAVLALFYPDENNQTRFLLTLRATYKGKHSAQVSFPGGKIAKKDSNLKQTALRETFEEVGILSEEIKIIRQITDSYIPPSNFLVTPFIGVIQKKPAFKPNYEVATTIEVLMSDLLNDGNLTTKEIATSYMKKEAVPCFKLNNYSVWGATAMMLSEIKDLFK